MKKIILLLICICLFGCTKIEDSNMYVLIDQILKSSISKSNEYRNGYKYYLPNTLSVDKNRDSNVVFKKDNLEYYMYVDLISYYYNVQKDYSVNESAFISMPLKYGGKYGYIEVIQNNDKYLIEIMYNYAKIEVIVDDDSVSSSIVDGLMVLNSIKYNNDIIKNMLDEDVLNYNEESFDIFDTTSSESNFLEVVEEYDNYNDDTVIPDYDLIN